MDIISNQAVLHKSQPLLHPQDPTQARYEHSYAPPTEKYFKTSNDEPALLLPVIGQTAHAILSCLRSHLNSRTGQCNPSVATIANEVGVASSTVKNNLAYLYQGGIVQRVQRQLHHTRRGKTTVQKVNNQYVLLERSHWTLDKVTRARAKARSTAKAPVLIEIWPTDEPDLAPLVAQDNSHQGLDGHKVDVTPLAVVQQSDAVAPDAASATETGAAATAQMSDLLAQVLAAGVKAHTARLLISGNAPDIIRQQLAYLDSREPRDRAATLVKSIREGWSPPAKYLQRVAAEEAARQEEERQAAVAQAAQQRRVEFSSREQQQAQRAVEAAELEAQWEAMGEAARAQIEQAARQRLGVLARSGACVGALQAMRRTLMREMQQSGQLADAQGNTRSGGPSRLEV